MSIMNRNRRLRYFNQGGANDYTTDVTYGVPVAQTGTPNTAGYTTPQVAGPDFSGATDYATAADAYGQWLSNPANQPQYYTDSTVAGFDPAQIQAQEGLYNAAGRYDTINNDLEAAYRADLDPDSAYNQRATSQAAQNAGNAYFGAGTPGSARGQYASSLASREALDNNRQTALRGLAGVQGKLTGGADIINQVGAERKLQTQRDIDEDIKRFNFNQLAPQQQADQQLAIRANEEALKAGNAPVSTSRDQGFGGFIKNTLLPTLGKGILSSLTGGLFNEGGPVHYKEDGGMIPQTQGGMAPQAYGQPMDMMSSGIQEVEEMSEIDMMEDKMNMFAMASGGDIVVTRKETRRKSK